MQNFNQKSLRKTLCKQRLALTPRQRKLASVQAFRKLEKLSLNLPKNAKIGIYLEAFGELPVQPIIDWIKRYHFDIYLPVVIHTNKPLKFIKMPNSHPKSWRLIKHALGMRQPANLQQAITANQLNIIFIPLVCVDNFGYRMGMGGGFYDRTLAICKTKPVKIGWAFDFQQVEKLAINPWDVKLDFAIFPSGLKKFSRYLIDCPQNNLVENEELSNDLIAQVLNPERLEDLLNRANAFGVVYSDDFLS